MSNVQQNSGSSGKMNKNSNRFKPYNKFGKRNYNKNNSTNEEENSTKCNRFQSCEKPEDKSFQSCYAPAVIRLCARRYPLTKDGRKYLEVGIIVKNKTSAIEIALGEICKKEIILNLKDWKVVMDYKPLIIEYFQFATVSENPLNINSETKFILEEYKNIKMIHMIQESNSLILANSTFSFLLTLNNCVKVYVKSLNKIIETLNEKLKIFKNVEDIQSHEEYDKSSIIDNELYALYFNKQ